MKHKTLAFFFAIILLPTFLAGCGVKPKNAPEQVQSTPEQATQANSQKAEPAEMPEDLEPSQEIRPEELAFSQEVTSSNAQDWIDLLCAHSWKAVDDLPDHGEWISIYTFRSDGTFTYLGGRNASEADADYQGRYDVSDDGTLTLVYTSGHNANITYTLGFNIDTITFTQISDEGLMYFHEDGCTTTLSAA